MKNILIDKAKLRY